MKTQSGMIIQHDHKNESWPENILWPVVRRAMQAGWRCGRTRVYTLKCGHWYVVPASKREGAGKTAKCSFCTTLWHWITTEKGGGVDPEHDAKDMHTAMLIAMQNDARRMGKLKRSISTSSRPTPGDGPENSDNV